MKTSNDTHVSYENAISGSAGSDRGVALRTIDMFTHFQCSFTTLVQISLAIGNVGVQHVKMELNSVLGEFDVKMALFSDESFTTQVAGQHVVNVPDSVYVGINVEDLNARYKLTMVNCFMTPDKEFNNVVKYNVITDRCVHSTESDYVSVLENGVSDQARFSVKSFIFSGDESNTDMFVHCKVRICDSVGEDCSLTSHCPGSRKRRSGDLNATLSEEALEEDFINLTTQFKLGAMTHKSFFKQRHSKVMDRIGSMTKKIFGFFG